jgi:acetyl-CoA carboxylase biotin carboxyl carrier protein
MKGPKKQPRASEISVPGVDIEQLERLLEFMAEHGLEEFEYSRGDFNVRLKKAGTRGGEFAYVAPAVPAHAVAHVGTVPAATVVPAMAAPVAAVPPAEQLHIIKSPIVGTFYAGASPEAGPFVKVGDAVEAGQTVCIVEAMKLMNEIEADMAGEVVRVLVENGHPVEYGEQLFAIRPKAKK